MRISDWSSDVCSSDLLPPDDVTPLELTPHVPEVPHVPDVDGSQVILLFSCVPCTQNIIPFTHFKLPDEHLTCCPAAQVGFVSGSTFPVHVQHCPPPLELPPLLPPLDPPLELDDGTGWQVISLL